MAHGYLCGCYYTIDSNDYYARLTKNYLPLLDSSAHTTIISTTSKTVLTQTFTNPSTTERIKQCIYTFPLHDGVSVVSFTCQIGKKVLTGLVKEKYKAKKIYDDAVAKGQTAGLLEQAPEASDVFSTKLGNIPAGQSIVVKITYVGELKHTETEGIRFTIPTSIAPRYGSGPTGISTMPPNTTQGIKITVDINMPEGSFIKGVQSPSHPIAVSMGTISTAQSADPTMSKASATLSLGTSALERDFVLIVSSKDVGIPKALLEIHPTIPNHRALMATLVPKFVLPPSRPEIVFVADRSGSMEGGPITMLIQAMGVLLKSMPLGVKFNICSYGSSSSFLWPKSKAYTAETLDEASRHVNQFSANMGGTQTHAAVKSTVERRFADIPLEIILLTDGDIWQQNEFFEYLNEQVEKSNGNIRVFPLGIGNGVSHALIEGVARAGNGFASAVQDGERLDAPVVRMLRGALSPHITDYTLEVKFEKHDEDFEVIEKVTEGMRVLLADDVKPEAPKATISLFDTAVNPEKDDIKANDYPHAHLPSIPIPHLHQAPHKIPSLFVFSRTSVYLLLSPETIQRNPTSVILRATSEHGPLALEIPIEVLCEPGTTIHQLAAKKAVQDLEEGRGWIYDAKDQNNKFLKERYPSCFQELIEREAVRLGEKFQIAGKWTSFVAVSANDAEIAAKAKEVEVVPEGGDTEDANEDDSGRKRRRSGKNQFLDTEAEVDEDEEDSEDYGDTTQSYAENVASSKSTESSYTSAGKGSQSAKGGRGRSSNPFAGVKMFGDSNSNSRSPGGPTYEREVGGRVGGRAGGRAGGSRGGMVANTHSALNMRQSFGVQSFGGQRQQTPSAPLMQSFNSTPPSIAPQRSSPAPPTIGSGPSNLFGGIQAGTSGASQGAGHIHSGQIPGPTHTFFSKRASTSRGFASSPSVPAPEPDIKPQTKAQKLLALISLQDFTGSWSSTNDSANELSKILGFEIPSPPASVVVEGWTAEEMQKAWVTLIVIKVLEGKMEEEEGTWGLVVEKARGWLVGLGWGEGNGGMGVVEGKAGEVVEGGWADV